MTIKIDLTRDSLFDSLGLQRLKESYMKDDEVSPQERFAFVSEAFSSNPEHAQRLYEYSSKHWLSYSTPILSFGRSKRGLPISCFLNYMDDSAEGLVDNLSETNWLSMLGGGVGVHLGIRNSDDKSTGVMPHLKMYDASSLAYRQGRTRRGSYAAFLDVSHPDIIQFLEMRKPTGDQNMRTLNLNHGVNISDKFMQVIERCMKDPEANDDWELVNPANGEVAEVVSAKYLWQKMLELRMTTGEPYFIFIDTANRDMPEWLQAQDLKINGSNLCTEIFLPTSADRTAVCCLSSLNLEYYDDWRGVDLFIPDVMEMLDNVLNYFLDNAPHHIRRAVYSASRERSVGLGTLGFHAYLQKNRMAIDGVMSKLTNRDIFKYIKKECERADNNLVLKRGACPDAAEFGIERRFSHHMAIAPNASSSVLLWVTLRHPLSRIEQMFFGRIP
jgi:ribonucleoside-diphosphate reductase alpha chain